MFSSDVRRRLSLLAGSSLVAAGAGALALLTPGAALALDECGLPSATVACAPGTYTGGITYTPAATTTVTLQEGTAGGVNVTQVGVQIAGGPGAAVTLDRAAIGTSTVTVGPAIVDNGGPGISVSSPDSDVVINLSNPGALDMPVTGTTAGVLASSGGAGTASVTLGAGTVTADDTAGAATGVAATTTGSGAASVDTGAATIDVTGVGGLNFGAEARSGSGSANLTGAGAVTVKGSVIAAGVYGSSLGGGNVTVAFTGPITVTGTSAVGVSGVAGGAGAVSLTAGPVTASGSNGYAAGIVGLGEGSGTVSISANGPVTVTHSGTGVGVVGVAGASVGGGGVTVTASGPVTVSGFGAVGVEARSTGAGSVSVSAAGPVMASGTGAIGVDATSSGDGNVSVTAGAVNATSTAILASSGSGDVSVTATGAVTSTGTDAIDATVASAAGKGAVAVTVDPGASLAAAGDGVFASNAGLGTVTVANNGAIGSAAAPVGGLGIDAAITNPLSSATLTVNGAGAVNSSGTGILAVNGGVGSTNVTAGAITAPTGISVTSTGPFAITAGSAVGATGSAILVNGAAGGTISVASGATVTGKGATGTAVIDVTSPAAVALNNAGTIRSNNASIPAAAGDSALMITGGPLSVVNSGRIDGRFELGAATAPFTFTNTSTGSWHFTGTQTLTGGADLIDNGGLIATQGATTLAFGAPAGTPGNAFDNTGVLVTGETTGPSTLTITGLQTFDNSGRIVFGSTNGGVSSNGVGDDRVVISGPGGAGTAFVGSGGSMLVMDASLGTAGQTGCAAAVVADCLSLPGGTVTGVTAIQITNTSKAPGGQTATPITLVDATGGSIATGAFTISPASAGYITRGGAGAISDGFFFYRLLPSATSVSLVSTPDVTAFQFAEFGQAVSDIWDMTTGTWFDRQADLRTGIVGLRPGTHGGVWLKMLGDWTRRRLSQSTTSFGTTFTYDTGYAQDTAALVGGVDLLGGGGSRFGWVAGLEAGGVDSNVAFSGSATRAHLTGTDFGGYVSAMAGGWYLDATVNTNFLTLNDNIPTVSNGALPLVTGARVNTWGGRAETGYKLGFGGAFVEPLAGISYARTDLHDLPIPGGAVDFRNFDSLRGDLGGRLGATATMSTFKVQVALVGRAWDEWRGDSSAVLVNPGAPVFLGDRFRGVFGDVGGQAELFSIDSRVSAFVNGDYKWKSRYRESTITLGARYQF